MQLCLHNTLFNYTTCGTGYYFAYITLPECYTDICMGVQHSCPNLIVANRPETARTIWPHVLVMSRSCPSSPDLVAMSWNTALLHKA